MTSRYFLSQFFHDDAINMTVPICTAYGGQWLCPTMPAAEDGWAIVLMLCAPQQIEAARQDPRVLVLPLTIDPSPLPQQVTDVYASWGATTGMSLGVLLAKLTDAEPAFGSSL